MELIRCRSYDLPALVTQVLGETEDQVYNLSGGDVKELFGSAEGIKQYYMWGLTNCFYCLRLCNELQVLPLALQITGLAG